MNVTRLVTGYLHSRPIIMETVGLGLINYSKLSRLIIDDLHLKKSDFDAVLISLRRYVQKGKESFLESKIRSVIAKSRMEILTKMAVVIIEKPASYANISELIQMIRKDKGTVTFIEGTAAKTLITEDTYLGLIRQKIRSRIISVEENTAKITIKSPMDIESTPGVVSYLYSLFSHANVNIIETLSCYTDTIFIISEKDVPAVIDFLRLG